MIQEDNLYWNKRYIELELQMKEMMKMALDTMERKEEEYEIEAAQKKKENGRLMQQLDKYKKIEKERKILKQENQSLSKELRKLKLLEHKFKVTFFGKITFKYLALKSVIKDKVMHRR
ncbi:hypothetical protein ACFVHQ_11870 [Actinomycetes bacterium NPDC127524]